MCPEHEMEKVNMYCEVCRRPVCHLCKLGGSHANHKVTSMSNAYKILKVRLMLKSLPLTLLVLQLSLAHPAANSSVFNISQDRLFPMLFCSLSLGELSGSVQDISKQHLRVLESE